LALKITRSAGESSRIRPNEKGGSAELVTFDFECLREGRRPSALPKTLPRRQKPTLLAGNRVNRHESATGRPYAREIDGILIGFRFPAAASSVNVPGGHFHFLSADKTRGDHVLSLTTGAAVASLEEFTDLRIRRGARARRRSGRSSARDSTLAARACPGRGRGSFCIAEK